MREVAKLISERLVDMFRRDRDGRVPALPPASPFQHDPHWRDLLLFNEYFHAETGLGLGAMHQTGWTGLVANLVQRKYREATCPPTGRQQPADKPDMARTEAAVRD